MSDQNTTTVLVEATETQTSVANTFGYTPSEVAVIQNSVAKGTSKIELALFLNICKSVGLNPFNKEIWCYKDNKGNLLTFAGRDGFLAKAQKNPIFNGIRSAEIRENDEWEIDVPNGIIKHKITKKLKERGEIIMGYAIVFRKDGEPTIETADFETYYKGKRRDGSLIHTSPWNTHSAEMIKKVPEAHALKKAFGISGVQSEYEFNIENGVAIPNNTKSEKNTEKLRQQKHIKNAKTTTALKQLESVLIPELKKEYEDKLSLLETAN